MHTFKDATGREWRVELDLAAAFRVDAAEIRHRGETLILTDPDRWFFRALMRSPRLQAQLLYQLCKPQADEQGVDEISFDAMLSTRIDDGAGGRTTVLAQGAIPALALELADFFQSCPTSLNRLFRAQESLQRLLETAAAGLRSDATEQSAVSDQPTENSVQSPE